MDKLPFIRSTTILRESENSMFKKKIGGDLLSVRVCWCHRTKFVSKSKDRQNRLFQLKMQKKKKTQTQIPSFHHMQLIILERERIDKQQQKQNNDEFFLFSNVPRVTKQTKKKIGRRWRSKLRKILKWKIFEKTTAVFYCQERMANFFSSLLFWLVF